MFRIKICGIRLKNDVHATEAAGADAVGLNFFPPSVRFLDPKAPSTSELAREAEQAGLLRVGVFVNETAQQMEQTASTVGIDAIQLHGDESLSTAQELIQNGRRVIRAIKLPTTELAVQTIDDLTRPWTDIGCHLLMDADAGAAHGGSGKTLDWPSLARWAAANVNTAWSLAGGLRQENVAEAIRTAGATSVDTASGVECPKGVKNHGRIESFCREARQAMQA